MTVKGAKELFTGDTATLIARVLMFSAIGYTGINQEKVISGQEDVIRNTEEIKISLARYEEKQTAMEKRFDRYEAQDNSEHARLQTAIKEQGKEFQELKEKYLLIPKPFRSNNNNN